MTTFRSSTRLPDSRPSTSASAQRCCVALDRYSTMLDPPGVSGSGCCTLSIQGRKGDSKRCPHATGDLEILVESKRVFGGSGRARTLLNESTARPIGTISSRSPGHFEPHFARNDYDLAMAVPKTRKEAEHAQLKASGLDVACLPALLAFAQIQIRYLSICLSLRPSDSGHQRVCCRIRVGLSPENPQRIEKPPRPHGEARRLSAKPEMDITDAPVPIDRRSRDTRAAPS